MLMHRDLLARFHHRVEHAHALMIEDRFVELRCHFHRILRYDPACEDRAGSHNGCYRNGSLHARSVRPLWRGRQADYARSRFTSRGDLSSRNPRNTGCRSFPSRVHSANFTWQTNTGFTQLILRIIDGVMPCTHAPPCFEGRSAKGQSARASAWNFLCSIARDFVSNPVPTLPAKSNRSPS